MAKWFAYVPLRDESRGALRNAYIAMMRTPRTFYWPTTMEFAYPG